MKLKDQANMVMLVGIGLILIANGIGLAFSGKWIWASITFPAALLMIYFAIAIKKRGSGI